MECESIQQLIKPQISEKKVSFPSDSKTRL